MLLDNGRTRVLADEVGRQALHCIRCSACLNVCPVYSRTGGHAYGSVYPGPIGAILTPQLRGIENAPSLPFASSLCGACYEVCPVKIDIPSVLLHLRAKAVEAKARDAGARRDARASPGCSAAPRRFALAQRLGRVAPRPLARSGAIRRLPPPLSGGRETRDLKPPAAAELPRVVAQEHDERRTRTRSSARLRLRPPARATRSRSPRAYRRTGALDREARVALFCERVGDYRAEVARVAGGGRRRRRSQRSARGVRGDRRARPAFPARGDRPGVALVDDDGLSPRQLDAARRRAHRLHGRDRRDGHDRPHRRPRTKAGAR